MKNSERAEAVKKMINTIRNAPDESEARIYQTWLEDDGTFSQIALGRATTLRALIADYERRGEALRKIQQAKGAYSRDPLTHASNAIDSMVDIASEAMNCGKMEAVEKDADNVSPDLTKSNS